MQIFPIGQAGSDLATWQGVHLFHFGMSSCSQKLRLFLKVKGIEWSGHLVDLAHHENYGAEFMAINPRGMVPVLVLDGEVHIESNEILALLEEKFPHPPLIPADKKDAIASLLVEEDALHHDLRHLSFRYVHGRTGSTKTEALMQAYRSGGTIGDTPDPKKEAEIAFYERLGSQGLDDATCRTSALRFRAAFERFEGTLASNPPYLLGAEPTVIDIAWFVYAYRLVLGGYPLATLHPRLCQWFEMCRTLPGWEDEVAPPPALSQKIEATRKAQQESGKTMAALFD